MCVLDTLGALLPAAFPAEVALDERDGMPTRCVVNLEKVATGQTESGGEQACTP